MTTQDLPITDFTTRMLVDQTPEEVFDAITNVRGWWSEEIEGATQKLNDEFTYQYQDVHRCQIQLIKVIPNQKVVWLVVDNYFKFTQDKSEWTGTKIVFEITETNTQTQLRFTHIGLTPAYECYEICQDAWNNYIQASLYSLITTGKGKPNSSSNPQTANEKKFGLTVESIAARFDELAQQEKWFEIQDELFANHVRSVEPVNSLYLMDAEGKEAVRKKGEDWVAKVHQVHHTYTTHPVVGGNHFAVGRGFDLTVEGFGRVKIDQIMMYEVKDGQIVLEQFFY